MGYYWGQPDLRDFSRADGRPEEKTTQIRLSLFPLVSPVSPVLFPLFPPPTQFLSFPLAKLEEQVIQSEIERIGRL